MLDNLNVVSERRMSEFLKGLGAKNSFQKK